VKMRIVDVKNSIRRWCDAFLNRLPFFRRRYDKIFAARLWVEEIAHAVRRAVLRFCAERASPVVRYMAETGVGTDRCLEKSCLPVRVHYYSPVPDISDLDRRNVWQRRSDLAGIAWDEERHLSLMQKLATNYGHECSWPHDFAGDDTQFFTNNSGFSFGCAAVTHSLIRLNKPKKIIEIGSGLSTKVIAAAVRRNRSESVFGEFIVVDPFADKAIENLDGVARVITAPAEQMEIHEFASLSAGDVLFVDSSHTVRIGGDVNFLILDVLPILRQGVLVHFHDVPMPFEYSSAYYHDPGFRVFWTESYLLQAFLIFNEIYEVLLPMNSVMLTRKAEFGDAWKHYRHDIHQESSHSFWIQRKK
jgi:Methyltransferase domain